MPDERSSSVTQYAFPEVQPQFFTRLTLREYSRPKPGSQATKNISGYIRLPLPTALTDSYNMQVNEEALGMIGNLNSGDLKQSGANMLAAGQSAIDAFTNAYNSGNRISDISKFAMQTLAVAPGISDLAGLGPFVTGQQVRSFAQSQTGLVRNPHMTSIFEGVRLKTYDFSWRMSPKSESEANKMNNMINYLKAYMHPAILQNSGGFALEYPFIANVEFVGLPKEVTPSVKDSFITSLSVASSAGNGLALYRDGQPVVVELSLHFQEINIQTRENFGYGSSQSLADSPANASESGGAGKREQ